MGFAVNRQELRNSGGGGGGGLRRSSQTVQQVSADCNHHHQKILKIAACQQGLGKMTKHFWCSRNRVRPTTATTIMFSLLVVATCLASGATADPAASNLLQRAESRVGGLDPNDYIDEAGELDVMANQRQIPTAQLMAAAGHLVPDNFFLPGGSIPAFHQYNQRLQFAQNHNQHQQLQHQQHQQHQQQQQQQGFNHHQQPQQQHQPIADILQTLASRAQLKYFRMPQQHDVIAEAASEPQQAQQEPAAGPDGIIDFDGYALTAAGSTPVGQQLQQQQQVEPSGQPELVASSDGVQAYGSQYEMQLAEQQVGALQHLIASQKQQQQSIDQGAPSDDSYAAAALGPAYQIAGMGPAEAMSYETRIPERPYGLPSKSSSKEPAGMLKPLGNPKTISSPVIDFVTNQLPKGPNMEKLAEKLPQLQTPTVFSFSSSKDPSEKVKAVNQKKRNVMKQAETFARAMIKSVNDKFGTNIGDQTDIPFLLSSFGPLGFAQNVLFDPTLLVSLLNSAEKTYLSDVLPEPAKAAIRPVLNIFRVPNKKRGDKANLSNIISFLVSGGRTGSPTKHRQGTGIEKQANSKTKATSSR